jgi:hypothetical protein
VAHVDGDPSSAVRGTTVGIRFIVLGGVFLCSGGRFRDCTASPSPRSVIDRGGITAPSARPSVQTRFVLEAMAETNRSDETRWDKMFAALQKVETNQQQLMGQQALSSSMTEQAAKDRDVMA